MRLRPFFCFFGGKWRAAPHYPPPRHAYIIEPFAGAAGYATTYSDRRVLLVEKDPTIAALWRWLIHPETDAEAILSLPLWDAEKHVDIDDLGTFPEAKSLIGFWCNKGAAQPHRRPSTWMTSNVRPNSHWGEAIRGLLAAQIKHIKHWRLIEGDWSVVEGITRPATWFFDPPYVFDGKKYKFSSRDLDFSKIAEVAQTRAGQVIVCENEGADWLPFQTFRSTKASPGKQKREQKSEEVIWTNDGSAQ